MAMVSVLRPFSYGQVVETNNSQSRTIKIKILEHLSSQYGVPNNEVSSESLDIETFKVPISTDSAGNPSFQQQLRSVSVSFKDWVPANWLNRTAQTISPPKVVVGQRVLLWRVGDSRQYYWEELDVDMRLKPDEHVVIAINNHNKGKTLDLDNAYMITYSTRDQRIQVRTNRNNGELSAFEVDINGGKGFLKIMDDMVNNEGDYQGNGLLIDSVNTLVKMQNIDESYIHLDKVDILMNCTGNRTSTITGLDKVVAGNMRFETTDITTKAKSVNVNANTITEVGSQIAMSAPLIKAGGGAFKISAGLSVGPPAPVASSVSASASAVTNIITFEGNITVKGNTVLNGEFVVKNSATFASPVTFGSAVSGSVASWSASCTAPNI